ncbi:MAG: hypothetical protein FWD68_05985, partial [Alphaproteobacteria bacterium]|nr:hypothetical protein [Alphaproteobacteria bacterium]
QRDKNRCKINMNGTLLCVSCLHSRTSGNPGNRRPPSFPMVSFSRCRGTEDAFHNRGESVAKWMTIAAGKAQFFPDFEPGATCPWSDPGSLHKSESVQAARPRLPRQNRRQHQPGRLGKNRSDSLPKGELIQ